MKLVLISAALVSAAVAPAIAQEAAAPAPAAAAASLNGDSPIEAIAALPAGKVSLDKNIEGLTTHPAYDQFKAMSLRAIAPMSGGLITDEKIAAVEADLKAAK